jgi:hypothetical protein
MGCVSHEHRRSDPRKSAGLAARKAGGSAQFAASLSESPKTSAPLRSPRGLWADLDIDISEEDISELRREMWKNFPRDDI